MKIRDEIEEFKVLARSVPSGAVVLFCMSVLAMNLFANKSVNLPFGFMALDCGIIFSWAAFLGMDVITKHYGPKAATEISLMAMAVNLLFCAVFFIGSKIPGVWGESYVAGSEDIINSALDKTFGGTWYVVLGSATAFAVSAFVNNFLNYAVGLAFKKNPDSAAAFVTRSYVSTAVGQFCDNMMFAFLVSRVFFGWSVTQCVVCSLTGMAAELLCEIIFSPVGYKMTKDWKKAGVGSEYFELRKMRDGNSDNGNVKGHRACDCA